MRTVITLILTTHLATDQLTAQQPAADSSIKQEIASLPSTSLVEVDLKDGHRLRGHIARRTDSDFSLQREKGKRTQSIAYDQVVSVSQVKAGHSHKKWIILGVAVGAVVIVVVIIVAVVKTKGPFAL
jgi:hypothetical protein